MANCKEDFLEEIAGHEIMCAEIIHGDRWDDEEGDAKDIARLPLGFTEKDYSHFLEAIDYEYDSGYGGQEVFGNIWYKDGTWSERGEYDGSEWWAYKTVPVIPDELKKTVLPGLDIDA